MKSAVIVFPGSNCDRDAQTALRDITGGEVVMQWHADADMPDVDAIVVPGGFSYGDYLRCGAIAGNSPVMREVVKRAEMGARYLQRLSGSDRSRAVTGRVDAQCRFKIRLSRCVLAG